MNLFRWLQGSCFATSNLKDLREDSLVEEEKHARVASEEGRRAGREALLVEDDLVTVRRFSSIVGR